MSDLTVVGVSKSFGRTRVLEGIDLHVPAGSLTAILGPSGCGKTTLLRLIAGFDRPDGGSISLGDRLLCDAAGAMPPERRRIGYVVQEGALFPHLTVAQNVAFGLPSRDRQAQTRADELLDLVGLDSSHARRYPHQLSGGQQQRVALARALAPRPSVILLDEPFASLDAGLREGMRRAVAETLAVAGATAVLVTHDQAEALSLADRVAVMQRGRVTQVAAPAVLYGSPVDVETATFVGEAIILDSDVRDGYADCALGRVRVAPHAEEGAGTLMLRPEQIAIASADATNEVATPRGTVATVLDALYFGHYATVRLQLVNGDVIMARPPGYAAPRAGDRVTLHVMGAAHVFPRPHTEPRHAEAQRGIPR